MRLTRTVGLCVVDVQEKIIPTIPTGQHVITECCRLIDAANLFDTPIILVSNTQKSWPNSHAGCYENQPTESY